MPTEAQLRDVLVSLEHGAPTVEDVLTALEHHDTPRAGHGRRRWLLAGTAAAAVLVAVAALTTVLDRGAARPGGIGAGSASSPLPTPAQLLPTWQFTVDPVPGYTITRDLISRVGLVSWVQESASVTATASPASGRFVLQEAAPGGYANQLAQQNLLARGQGQDVTVHGRPGYYTPGTHIAPTGLNPTTYQDDPWAIAAIANETQPTLIWQLPNGTWGMLMGTFGFQPSSYSYDNTAALTAMERIADAVGYVAHQPVSMPFQLTGVPDNLVPESMGAYTAPALQCLGYGTGAGPYPTGSVGSVITVCREDTRHGQTPTGKTQSLLTSGKTLATRTLPDGTTLIILASPAHPNAVTTAVAAQLVRDADVSPDFDRPSTWLTVH